MNLIRLLASRSLKRQNDRLKEEIVDACTELAAYDEEVNKLRKQAREYEDELIRLFGRHGEEWTKEVLARYNEVLFENRVDQ